MSFVADALDVTIELAPAATPAFNDGVAINDRGEIAVVNVSQNLKESAFLLVPQEEKHDCY